jgi:two-component system, LuxR family, sensor kinase FixL
MSVITIVWSMIVSACLTLAAINFLIWCKNRKAWANLLFSSTATSIAVFTFFELWMMRADTLAEFATAMRWAHVPMFLWIVSTTWFVRLYFGAGRRWLAWSICGLRAFSLFPNFLAGQNLNYREITVLKHVPFLNESVTIAEGVSNRWMLVGQLSVVLLVIFVADASITAWRRSERRKALMIGGSIEFFLLAGLGEAVLVFWGHLQVPIVFSLPSMGMIAVMAFELSRDVLRSSQLVVELQVSEAELRESKDRMSLAAEATNLGVWIRYLKRNEIWASDSWRVLFGFTASDRLDLDVIFQRLHPEDRETLRQTLARAMEGTGKYETEFRVVRPDGQMRWIASRGHVEFNGGGNPILARGVSLDITERKQAEQETHLLRQEIAHVGRISMMGQLASALAHEINQPLGAILRNAEAAELFLQHASPDFVEIRAILADIRKDDQRAGAVIDRMRGLLKRNNLDTRAIEVHELVADVVALVRADAVARRSKLNVDVPGDLPPVRGDRVHLQQVLLNLLLNGLDALNGAIGRDRLVTLTARLNGRQTIEIAVSDTGHGIPVDKLQQVFDPFFTTKPNGMGMGLPISRTIIEAHGGTLWAENHNGNGGGAVFRFTLPIAEEAASQ